MMTAATVGLLSYLSKHIKIYDREVYLSAQINVLLILQLLMFS